MINSDGINFNSKRWKYKLIQLELFYCHWVWAQTLWGLDLCFILSALGLLFTTTTTTAYSLALLSYLLHLHEFSSKITWKQCCMKVSFPLSFSPPSIPGVPGPIRNIVLGSSLCLGHCCCNFLPGTQAEWERDGEMERERPNCGIYCLVYEDGVYGDHLLFFLSFWWALKKKTWSFWITYKGGENARARIEGYKSKQSWKSFTVGKGV